MFSKLQVTLITILTLIGLVISPILGASLPRLDQPHDNDDTFDLIIEGPVQTINFNVITIADIVIEVGSDDPLLSTLQVGNVIQASGNVDESRDTLVLIAENVVVTGSNIITPIISINGPVEAVNQNIVTIYGFNIQLNPGDAILLEINIGDVISVSGNIGNFGGVVVVVPVQVVIVVNAPDPEATPEATADPEATPEADPGSDDLPVTIVIEGPVQAINVNIITIFDINVVVAEDDPILTEIVVGDTVRVEGNLDTDGDTIIIIAINITIIQVDIITGIPSNCKVTGKGHIKCKSSKPKSKKGSKKS